MNLKSIQTHTNETEKKKPLKKTNLTKVVFMQCNVSYVSLKVIKDSSNK